MSKYRQIAGQLRQQIESGALGPGDKLNTEQDLRARFGVSRQTVRMALSVLEAEGVIERRQGSGSYVAGQAAARAQSRRVGVISTYIDAYIFPGILRGIEQALAENGYAMQLACTQNRVEHERKLLAHFLSGDVDGLIVEPTKSSLPNPNLPYYDALRKRGVPVVFFDARYPGYDAPYVALDDRAAGRAATAHLIGAGHTAIAGFFQGDDEQGRLRYAGYLDALLEAGLMPQADKTLWFASEDIPGLFADEGRVRARLSGATAAFCYNDDIALRLMAFAKAQGLRLPEDLSVVSVDNSAQAAYASPPLTSVHHPKEALGMRAAQSLLALLSGNPGDVTHVFPAVLHARQSVQSKIEPL